MRRRRRSRHRGGFLPINPHKILRFSRKVRRTVNDPLVRNVFKAVTDPRIRRFVKNRVKNFIKS